VEGGWQIFLVFWGKGSRHFMVGSMTDRNEAHMQIVADRYADRENIGVLRTDEETLYNLYLSKAMKREEIAGKRILELGAGCSQYIPLFLNSGCADYYANDLIPERLAATRVTASRYHELPGDFLKIALPEPVDIAFATLTMMCVKPLFADFAKRINESLKPGGVFMSMEANYYCPYNTWRNYFVKGSNPVIPFSPFAYARIFKEHGFEIEKMVPFTSRYGWTTGNWALGTAFWMRARKL
jgi:SAM-dependent methyltransferase